MPFSSYDYAARCSGGATQGALALMRHVLDTTPGARNLGIYNCRAVRGGSTRSIHSEGRALDIGMPMSGGRATPAGHRLVQRLIKQGDKLGIQAIIYDRKIWSAKSPSGRYYGGVNPHYDHLHVELNRSAASKLTLATVRRILAAVEVPPADDEKPSGEALPKHANGSRVLRQGMRGTDVAFVQRYVGSKPDDGDFGPVTLERVKRYQRILKIDPDGVVGPRTWAAMGVKR